MTEPTCCVIIPARYASTRFPGKPLVPLLGKPMVLWVAELAAQAVGQAHVYIATEDSRIQALVQQAGYGVLMTSKTALTGTDRLAEAAEELDYDIYINVQGDEPLVSPEDIRQCAALKAKYPKMVVNGFSWLSEGEDAENVNIPKVITNESGIMVYLSRAPLPAAKCADKVPQNYKKQVCIYGFTRDDLRAFAGFGRKSELEDHEDIEILRFLELGRQVLMYECHSGSLAVDTPADVKSVEVALQRNGQA
ncbi:MAG: 3-deoxy-manno-octulosonate cytidylyltransferase [Wenzhouxiangella sp.]